MFSPDDVNISPVKEADSKLSKNDVISNIQPVTSTQTSNNDRDSIMQLANENPLGIKIKEITKPEEIRITDDKPKPFNPFKSTTTSTTTIASTTASLDVTTETEAKAATESSTIALTTETLKESKELSTEDTNQSPNRGELDILDNGVSIDNNSSDAPSPPPPVKALVEPETLLNSGADSNSIADDASNKNVRQIVEHSTSGSDIDQFSEVNDFSSTTELSTDTVVQYDASTTEHGEEADMVGSSTPQNNVVFIRHGGKTEPFHISGTDGLIRVEELEIDVSSTTESDNSNNQESTPRDIETSSSDDGISSGSSEFPSMESSTPTTSEPETFDEIGTIPLDIEKQLDSALSSNATSIDNLSNNSIEVSTLDDGLESSSEFASSERVYQTVRYRSDEKSSTASPLDGIFETVYYPPSSTEDSSESSSTIDPDSSSSSTATGDYSTTDQSTTVTATESLSTAKPTDSFEEEQEATPDTNPYYPVDIPVDVSIHNEQDEKRRLPSKVLDDAIASSTSGPTCHDCDDIDKSDKEASSTQGPSDQEMKQSHENDVVEARVPGEPSLIPEWERNSTEKTTATEASTTLGPSDDTEINALNKTVASNENSVEKMNKSAALMLETTVAPVDSDEIYGRKEPTTARTTTKGYASANDSSDDTSSPSSEEHLENSTTDGALPDDDAESIKLTSSASDDDDTNESYETRPLKIDIPDSIQNYWRYVSKVNGWTV